MAPTRTSYRTRRAARQVHDYRHPRSDNQSIALRALNQPQHRAAILHLFSPFSASRLQVDTFYGLQDIHSHVTDLSKLVVDYCETIEAEIMRNEATCYQRFMTLPIYSMIADWARTSIPNDARVFPAVLGPLCAECGRQGHTQIFCPQYFCLRCNSAAPGHLDGECGPNPMDDTDDVPPLAQASNSSTNSEWPNTEAAAEQWPTRHPTPFPVAPPRSHTPSDDSSDQGIQRGYPSWARANGRINPITLLGEETVWMIMNSLQQARTEESSSSDEPGELQYPTRESSSSPSI